MNAIETDHLTKRFGDLAAVDGLTLSVADGEIFGLVGPDGAGKTTTMRLLTAIMDPTGGDAWVAGHHIVRDAEKIKENIGYMSQRFGLYADLTVMENINFYADIYNEPRRGRREKIDRRLEEVEELLVHSFDFIYFYGSDIRRYIVSIWKSWQSIPQLDTKVREYLLRTLATAATKHLGDSDPCGRARKDVESCLKRVSAVLGPRSYATAGLAVLQKEWSSKLEIETAARVLVTQLVPAFLQGPEALAAVRHYFSKPSRRSSDSTFQDLAFVGDHISNPLEFIEQHTRAEADVHRSFWMLHRLAFEAIDTVV